MKAAVQRSVPVTRRFLTTRPVRTAAGAAGIGLALMLMLLLAGLWVGVQDRVTTYDDHLGADLVVVPAGTRNLFADPGALPAPAVDAIAQTPGVTASRAAAHHVSDPRAVPRQGCRRRGRLRPRQRPRRPVGLHRRPCP